MKNWHWKGVDTVIFCAWPYLLCICWSFPFRRKIYGRRVLKLITQRDLLTFALVKLLVFAALFKAPKKHVLKQAVICSTLGRLSWSLWKWSVFFNVHLVGKSHAEFSPPISAFMELCSNANLPCLVHLALKLLFYKNKKYKLKFQLIKVI